MHAVPRNRFYLLAGFVIAALVLAGFSRSYFLKFLFDRPPLTLIMHLHAAAATAWVVLFIVQARLAARRRLDLHRSLGMLGAVIAVSMVVLTALGIVEVIHDEGRIIGGMPGWKWMALSSISIATFAGLVAAAMLLRRRSEWHKRLMLVATISVSGPAIGRLLMILGGGPAARYTSYVIAALLAAAVVHDWLQHRRLHPAFLIGTVVLIGATPVKLMLANSAAWAQFARWVAAP